MREEWIFTFLGTLPFFFLWLMFDPRERDFRKPMKSLFLMVVGLDPTILILSYLLHGPVLPFLRPLQERCTKASTARYLWLHC